LLQQLPPDRGRPQLHARQELGQQARGQPFIRLVEYLAQQAVVVRSERGNQQVRRQTMLIEFQQQEPGRWIQHGGPQVQIGGTGREPVEPGPLVPKAGLEFRGACRVRLAAVLEQSRDGGHGQQGVAARGLVRQGRGQVPRLGDCSEALLLRGQISAAQAGGQDDQPGAARPAGSRKGPTHVAAEVLHVQQAILRE
jgi:hypothetical protein